jgi:hypothetical protein
MRTHAAIIRDGGGPKKVHAKLGLSSRYEMVKSWMLRDRIPSEYWRLFADEGLCTLHELAIAADVRKNKLQDVA